MSDLHLSPGNPVNVGRASSTIEREIDDARTDRDPIDGDLSTDPAAGYAYGPPTVAASESNYVSDEALLLWLAEKQTGLHGDLQEQMDLSRKRSKLIEDLTHLKQLADGVDSVEEFDDLRLETSNLVRAYEGTEFEPELQQLRDELLATAGGPDSLARQLALGMGMGVEGMSEMIQARIDALGRDDQLALIAIQSLTADIRENAQLVSNLLASSNQTSNSIVGNIRG